MPHTNRFLSKSRRPTVIQVGLSDLVISSQLHLPSSLHGERQSVYNRVYPNLCEVSAMRQVTIITNAEMIRLIKRYLKNEGLTTIALAREIGVNYQYFHDMLAGRSPVTAEVARYFKFERLDYVFTKRKSRLPRQR